MLCSKVCILSVNSAEEKEPAVGYLSMRTRQPNHAPFPELLHDEVQKSWTLIYAVQSTAGLENCCQHPGSFWAASPPGLWWPPCPCTLLCYLLCSHPWQCLTAFSKQLIRIMITLCRIMCSRSKWSLYIDGGLLMSKEQSDPYRKARVWYQLMLRGLDCMKYASVPRFPTQEVVFLACVSEFSSVT